MPNVNRILLLLILAAALSKGTIALILLIKSYRVEAKNRIYHTNKEKT